MKLIDGIRMMERGESPGPPVAQLVGFSRVHSVGPGTVSIDMETDPARHANPMGTVHGGILCDLADAAMGMSWATNLDEGETFTTLELKINFLKPVFRARLRAVGRVVKQGRTIGLVECDIFDEKQSLVARVSSTVMTLRGEQAKGR